METKTINLKDRVRGEFIAWLMTQDPQEKYYWEYSSTCACGKFLNYLCDQSMIFVPKWEYRAEVWEQFNGVAREGEWTYGALLKRVLQA